jgi:hypothetical protein
MFEENLGRVFADYYRYTQKTDNAVSFFKYMLGEY